MSPDLTHLDAHGHAFMVDVTDKATTAREATVRCVVAHVANTVARLNEHGPGRSSALGVNDEADLGLLDAARLAGLSAGKRTSELIPLCHPLPLDDLDVAFLLGEDEIEVHAHAATQGQTGVEMEALTACALAAVTLLGACRVRDPLAAVDALAVWDKRGGRSGHWRRLDDGSLTHDPTPVDASESDLDAGAD